MKNLIITLISIGAIFLTYHKYKRFEYSKPVTSVYQDVENETIAVLGASWASHQSFDSLITAKTGKKVFSLGMSGARSSRIHASIDTILKVSPEYCILTPSVNDMAQMMGTEYYAYHNKLTAKILLENNIKPIFISMPNVDMEGILESQRSETYTKGLAWLNGSSGQSYLEYREALREGLKGLGVIIVDFDKVTPFHSKEYFKDAAHLNEEGKILLVEEILRQGLIIEK